MRCQESRCFVAANASAIADRAASVIAPIAWACASAALNSTDDRYVTAFNLAGLASITVPS